MPSANKNIIVNLTLVGICASLLCGSISIAALKEEPEAIQAAISIQRAAGMLIRIGCKVFDFISGRIRKAKALLVESINLLKGDLYDLNYQNRIGSVARVYSGLVESS